MTVKQKEMPFLHLSVVKSYTGKLFFSLLFLYCNLTRIIRFRVRLLRLLWSDNTGDDREDRGSHTAERDELCHVPQPRQAHRGPYLLHLSSKVCSYLFIYFFVLFIMKICA